MQIITEKEAIQRRYSECAMCPKSTEGGCLRTARIEFLDAKGRRVDEMRLPDDIFCSVACIENAARACIEEINNETDPALLSQYKKWKGEICGFSLGYAKIGLVPSADE